MYDMINTYVRLQESQGAKEEKIVLAKLAKSVTVSGQQVSSLKQVTKSMCHSLILSLSLLLFRTHILLVTFCYTL